jgi:hypothetical protein
MSPGPAAVLRSDRRYLGMTPGRGYLFTTRAAMNLSRTERQKMTFFPTFMYFKSPDFIILSMVARLRRVYSAASAFVKYSCSGTGRFYLKRAVQETP